MATGPRPTAAPTWAIRSTPVRDPRRTRAARSGLPPPAQRDPARQTAGRAARHGPRAGAGPRPGSQEVTHARRHLCSGLDRAPGTPADHRQPARRLAGLGRGPGPSLVEQHVFRDEGYSGSRLDRPGLDGLRDAVRDAAIDVVAVLSPDRLARKYAYQVLLLEE